MVGRPIDEQGAYVAPTLALHSQTLVFDRARRREIMRIQGVLVLPVGSTIELADPDVSAIVVGVRLSAGAEETPVEVCLDVDVPAEYWD
jgi:hypothetical protein